MLPLVNSYGGLVLTTIVASTQFGVTPLTQTYLINELPGDMKGSGLGLIRTVHLGLGSSGPLLVGLIADFGYFDVAFVLLSVIAGGALVLTLIMPER